MNIQKISIYSPLIRTRRGNTTPKVNLQAQDSVSFSGLFSGSEKREYLKKAKKYQKDAQYQIEQNKFQCSIISSRVNQTIEEALLIKENTDKQIKQVYDLATLGLHSGFQLIQNFDESFTEFGVIKDGTKTSVQTMSEYDSEGHLRRKTYFEQSLPKKIEVYKENGKKDIITKNKFKNTEIQIDYEQNDEKFGTYSAKSIINFKDNQIESILNNVNAYAQDCVNIGEIVEFSKYQPNIIKELKLGFRKNSLDERNCEARYVFSPVGENELDEVHYDISQDIHGAKRIGKRFSLRNHGKNILNLEKNYQKSSTGEESSDLKYYFSDDRLIQTAVNLRSRNSIYLANEIYRYTNEQEPSSCKLGCKMNAKNGSCFEYRKKFEF